MPIMRPLVTMPDDSAPRGVGRKMGGQRDDDLNRNRNHADRRRRRKKRRGVGRKRDARQGDSVEQAADDDQAPVLDAVGERHQKKEAERVPDLRHRHDETRRRRAHVQRGGDLAGERLGVINVRDGRAAGEGEEKRRRGADLRGSRRSLRGRGPNVHSQ
jgi:hypothetical protein